MSDTEKSREQLIDEMDELRRRVSLLEGDLEDCKEANQRIVDELRSYRKTFLQQLEDHSAELLLLNDHLMKTIAERRRAESEVKASREQLRMFAAHLQTVQEKERAMIAREIHDELAQALTAIKIDLMDFAGEKHAGHSSRERKLRQITSFIDEVIENVHRVAMELRPAILDDLGLESAIEWQLQEFRKRTNCCCSFRSSMGKAVMSKEATTALFRICQEALVNVARHARADKVEVEMRLEGQKIVLTVKDNGCGIAVEKTSDSRSLGLTGMQERAAILGGEVSITGSGGKGTTVIASLPVGGEGG